MRALILLLLLTACAGAPRHLGGAGIFTNDALGDGHDRWRTMALTRSELFAHDGQIIEARLRGEMIAPRHISRPPQPGARPYVGLIAPGLLLHRTQGARTRILGGELVATGPATGVSQIMRQFHGAFGFQPPNATSGQLGNRLYPGVMLEERRRLGPLQPFAALDLGAEHLARAGVDLLIGPLPGSMIRDPVTGQLLSAPRRKDGAPLLTLGVDAAHVARSAYLPGTLRRPARLRARAGLDLRFAGWDLFYGLTWHGAESRAQKTGQITGSIGALLRY